jgi:subtilisin family serine protease
LPAPAPLSSTTANVPVSAEDAPLPTVKQDSPLVLSLNKLRVYNLPVFPGRFIIRLAANAAASPESFRSQFPKAVTRVFTIDGFPGFAGKFTNAQLKYFDSHAAVADILPDYAVQLSSSAPASASSSTASTAAADPVFTAASNFGSDDIRRQIDPPSYGLKRISHRTSEGFKDYIFPRRAGKGVTVYVLDTGIMANLTEFEGRVVTGVSLLDEPDCVDLGVDGCDASWDDPFWDLEGHGTHLAGIIGSKTYGVAKRVRLVAVKVVYAYNFGPISSLIAGIQYVEQQCALSDEPCVMNISLTVNERIKEVDEVIKKGRVPIITAAGNGQATSDSSPPPPPSNPDDPLPPPPPPPSSEPSVIPLEACTVTPAGSPGAFAVGAIDVQDRAALFSNYGNCVKIYAPGVDIISLAAAVPGGTLELDGTSQASAFVAGIAAVYLSYCRTMTKYELYKALLRYSTRGKVRTPRPGTPNRIAYVFPDSELVTKCRKWQGFDFPEFSGMIETGPTGVAV